MTEVAIVILNWNGRNYLKKFLPPLIAHSKKAKWEIVVADNHSEDNSLSFMAEKHPGIKIIRLDANYGFAEGYNRALKQINSKYFLLLNSDIEVTENWLDPLVTFLNKNESFAACSPVVLDYNNKNLYEYAGAAGGYIDKYGYTFCRGRLFNTVEPANQLPEHPTEVFWTTGACMLIRSHLFTQTGGFDEKFFAHMEEVDLCWRLKNKGYKLALVPKAKVYHVGGGTLPKNNPFKTFLNYRNNLFLLYKNLPENKLSGILLQRQILDGLSGIMYLTKLQWKNFAAIINAHADFRKNKSRYIKFRHQNNMSEMKISHPEMYRKSIVIDYFLAGNKKFNQLRSGFGKQMDVRIVK